MHLKLFLNSLKNSKRHFIIRGKVLGFIVWLFYRSLLATWRIRIIEPDAMKACLAKRSPVVLAHWHGDEIPLIALTKRYRIATITSTSKDGEMMNTVLHLLGAETVRGSSTRGAVNALKGLIRLAREGFNTSFAVDGPKGPIHVVKPGVFEVSRLISSSGGHIFAAGLACDRKWTFEKAWNKAYLPKPFAKIVVQWVGPFGPLSKEEDPRSLAPAQELTDALRNASALALKTLRDFPSK